MIDSQELANAVKQVLAGKTVRDESERIGLHFTTLYDLMKGRSKSRETIVKFARGFGLDVNTWLGRYGYEPSEEDDPSRLAERFLQAVKASPEEMTYDPELESVTVQGFDGAETLSPQALDTVNRAVRHLLQQARTHLGNQSEGGEGE